MSANGDADASLGSPGLIAANSGVIVVPDLVTNRGGTRFSSSILCPLRKLVGSSLGLRHPLQLFRCVTDGPRQPGIGGCVPFFCSI